MKKLFLLIAAATLSLSAMADEGMWMLPYLQKMNAKDMKAKGCKLSPEEIYSMNHASLKDAIVVFGGGCTGEIVSPEGLVFTNHHCGFGSIQALSSVEHDYLRNGFWAMNNAEELPAPGLKVRFIRQIADVTADVLAGVPNIAKGEERAKTIATAVEALEKKLAGENPGMEISVKPFFGGNQYFAFVQEVFEDVRLVGAPPQSVGKFGGDTDNWMWPRHTGDFSIFRVYAGPDNKPAEYAPENKPYKAEKYLNVSAKGYKEGDFAMIMGFPGSTQRYMTSYEIDRMLKIENPQRIFIRGERQDILSKAMAASDAVRIQYASKYAQSSNYWKNSIGMSRGIEKLGVKARKKRQQDEFQRWAEQNTLPEEGFIDALATIEACMDASGEAYASWQYLSEALLRAVELTTVTRAMMNPQAPAEQLEKYAKEFFKDYDAATDRKVAQRMMEITYKNCKMLPSFFEKEIFAASDDDQAPLVAVEPAISKYVNSLYDNTVFADEQKTLEFIAADKDVREEIINNDPAMKMTRSLMETFSALRKQVLEQTQGFSDAHRLYIAGLMRMQPDKAWAPDANFTIRLTYGNVLPYSPADGVEYDYYTTLKGVMEKENPENPTEFTVPERLKELYAARDFGRYANAKGELPTCFLANCDITGGNSGSPVLNARGELIGLAFDGNWEAMSGDVAFEPGLQRTIAVDVRYVLFIIDKFAGAGWLLDEMQIK